LQDRGAAQVARTKSGRSWGLANEQGCHLNCPRYLTRRGGQTAEDTDTVGEPCEEVIFPAMVAATGSG